jgi:hypothetical protein
MRPFLTHAIFHNTGLSHFLTITIADFHSCEFEEMFTIVDDSSVTQLLSRITNPDFFLSDPTTATKWEGGSLLSYLIL